MAAIVYLLCALTSLSCCVLLLRAWHASRSPLLFWSGFCFAWFAINNVLLFLDREIILDVDFALARAATAFVGAFALLIALVWESK